MQRSWDRRLAGGSEGCMRLRQKAVGKVRKGWGWDALTLEDLVTYKDLCFYSWLKKSPFSPPCSKNLVPPPHPPPPNAHTLLFSQPPCSSASQTWGTSGPARGCNVRLLGPSPTQVSVVGPENLPLWQDPRWRQGCWYSAHTLRSTLSVTGPLLLFHSCPQESLSGFLGSTECVICEVQGKMKI